MKYHRIAMSLLCLTSVSCLEAFFEPRTSSARKGERNAPKDCGNGPKHMRITGRHIEGKGVGYNQGYSTLEGFFAPDQEKWSVLPFLDVRGHVFDNGKFAANAGLGIRGRAGCRVYGANVYYDYRNSKKTYGQVGVGFETLGTVWDFRINGYIPVGNRVSHPYKTKFSHFEGNSMILSRKYEFSMTGVDAEAGGHWGFRNYDFFAGVGPYYFNGKYGPNAWGGKARINGWWKEYVGLQVSYSYDNVFKNIVQGEVSLSLPLGPRPKVRSKTKQCNTTCDEAAKIDARLVQPVYRDEIIVLNHHRKNSTAINPATGDPYVFWFVNNLSHSAGTFESPFNTLANAQAAANLNDVIYVYNGDGTSTGMNHGISLQNGQQLLGATTDHRLSTTVGKVTVPAQASGNLPLIMNGSGQVVNLASDNTVSGFYILNSTGQAILGSGVNNFTATQNFIQGANSTFNNIEMQDASGVVTISGNTIMTGDNNILLQKNGTSSPIGTRYIVTNNRIDNNGGATGYIFFDAIAPQDTSLLIANNIMTGSRNVGITATSASPATNFSVVISNNDLTSSAPMMFLSFVSLTGDVTVTGNTVVSDLVGIELTTAVCNLNVNISENDVTSETSGILVTPAESPIIGTISNNSITMTTDNPAISLAQSGTAASFTDLTVSGNIITGGTSGISYQNTTTGTSTSKVAFIQNVFDTSSINGILIAETASINTSFDIEGNIFNGFGTHAVNISQGGTGTICVEFDDNTSVLFPNAYLLQQTSGVFNLMPPLGNVGQLVETGTITPVSSCD